MAIATTRLEKNGKEKVRMSSSFNILIIFDQVNMVEKHALYTYHLVKKELRGDVLVCADEIKARKCLKLPRN